MDLEKFFNAGGKFEINGFSFEEPSIEMLSPDIENIEHHVALQPAAIAYFGAWHKRANHDYEKLKKQWGRRWNEMYAMASTKLTSKKPTINDIEAKAESMFGKEIEDWEKKLEDAKEKADLMESFWDGWKQKGFSINNCVALAVEGIISKDYVNDRLPKENKIKNEARIKRAISLISKGGNEQEGA